jgi:hypothetical protein
VAGRTIWHIVLGSHDSDGRQYNQASDDRARKTGRLDEAVQSRNSAITLTTPIVSPSPLRGSLLISLVGKNDRQTQSDADGQPCDHLARPKVSCSERTC